jgi:hypothetical protein
VYHQEIVTHSFVLTCNHHLVHDIAIPESVARVFFTLDMDNAFNPLGAMAYNEDVANAG